MGPATVSSLGPLNVIDCTVPNNRKKEKKKRFILSLIRRINLKLYDNYQHNDQSKSFNINIMIIHNFSFF